MSKNIPRKIKKACKNITLVYGNDEAWSLIDNIPKYRRNTKWNRKAISFIKREEKLKLKAYSSFCRMILRSMYPIAQIAG